MIRFNELLEKNKDELARTLSAEMGKPLQQSYNELKGAAKKIKYFTDHSEKWLAEEWVTTEGENKEKIVYEPLGIVANISAWNYPYLIAMNVLIPALIGGNAVFYKPSEYSTLTGLHICKLFYQSGVPENVLQPVIGKGCWGFLRNYHSTDIFLPEVTVLENLLLKNWQLNWFLVNWN
jgi:acyl-CoA reductase-like NAD-dependent aldehyde dehydrogenase